MITRLTLLQGIRFSFCFFLLRNTVCLLLVKAGGCPEKWRSHGQKRKPFSESEWIVIPELLPVIHTCFFLCHVVCSAVILKLSTSTSTFHLITVPKLWLSLTACTFPSRRPATFFKKRRGRVTRKVTRFHPPHRVQPSTEERTLTSSDERPPSAHSHGDTGVHASFLPITRCYIFALSARQLLRLSRVLSRCRFHWRRLMRQAKCARVQVDTKTHSSWNEPEEEKKSSINTSFHRQVFVMHTDSSA